jgi:hypothetical protein
MDRRAMTEWSERVARCSDSGGEAATPQSRKFNTTSQLFAPIHPTQYSRILELHSSLVSSLTIDLSFTRQNAAAVIQQPTTGAFTTTCVYLISSLSHFCASISGSHDMLHQSECVHHTDIHSVHHPIPQHVSTVPQLRSPPPPQPPSQPQSGYGYGQQGGGMPQQGNGYNMHPAFGGFMNDPTAQLGFQMGKTAMDAGQQYMEQNVRLLLPQLPFPIPQVLQVVNALTRHQDTNNIIVRSLRLRLRLKALLQRLKHLRRHQTPHHPVPMVAPPVVTPTTS